MGTETTRLFGRSYNNVGNSNSDFLIKTKGQVKIQWGNKFIDLLKDGKLNIEANFINKVANSDKIGSIDGIYYAEEDGSVWLVIGSNKINLLGEVGNTYVSFIAPQETTAEQKTQALKNIGFLFKTLEEATSSGLQSGIVFCENTNKLYVIIDGTLQEYQAKIPNPFTEQFVIAKADINKQGALVIKGESKTNSLVFGDVFLYKEGTQFRIESESSSVVINENTIIGKDSIEIHIPTKHLALVEGDVFQSIGATKDVGFMLYMNEGESTLIVDNLIVRNGFLIKEVTHSGLLAEIETETLLTSCYYKIIDYQNPWELVSNPDLDSVEDDLKVHPIVVRAVKPNAVSTEAYFWNQPQWKIEYDVNFTDSVLVDGTNISSRGKILYLKDEFNNSANYDFKHLKFLVDGNWSYTFDKDGEDASLTGNITDNHIEIEDVLMQGINYEDTQINVNTSDDYIIFYGETNGNTITKVQGPTLFKAKCLNNTIVGTSNVILNGDVENNNITGIFQNTTLNNKLIDNIFIQSVDSLQLSGDMKGCIFLKDINKLSCAKITNCKFDDSVLNVTIPEEISDSYFHFKITDVTFNKEDNTQWQLFVPNKTKDVYYNNDDIVVIVIPDLVFPGMIVMYNGANPIPKGWAICDGNNGTPNLIGNFIKAGNTTGEVGGYEEILVKEENMPEHTHTFVTPSVDTTTQPNHSHTISGSGGTNTTGKHTHSYTSPTSGGTGGEDGGSVLSGTTSSTTSESGDHSHNVSFSSVSVTGAGEHKHTITLSNLELSKEGGSKPIKWEPKFFSLIFIMKLEY